MSIEAIWKGELTLGQCKGKRAWRRKMQAQRALRVILDRASTDPTMIYIPRRVYRCSECHQFHLTSKPLPKGA